MEDIGNASVKMYDNGNSMAVHPGPVFIHVEILYGAEKIKFPLSIEEADWLVTALTHTKESLTNE